jgi:hypothetical protein
MIVTAMPEWKEKFVQLSRDMEAIVERKRSVS